jgi:hypothetical protein
MGQKQSNDSYERRNKRREEKVVLIILQGGAKNAKNFKNFLKIELMWGIFMQESIARFEKP